MLPPGLEALEASNAEIILSSLYTITIIKKFAF